MKNVRACFNQASKTYDDHNRLQNQTGLALIEAVKKCVDNPNTILDVGCGTGNITEELVGTFQDSQCDALDFAEHLLIRARARKGCRATNFILGDFDKFIAVRKYDLIFSNLALHWSKHLAFTLKRLRASLSAKGLFAFTVPLMGTFFELPPGLARLDFSTAETISTQLGNANFKIICQWETTYTYQFASALTALRSLKLTGTHYAANRICTGLKGKGFIEQLNFNQLTYHIGFFLVKPI